MVPIHTILRPANIPPLSAGIQVIGYPGRRLPPISGRYKIRTILRPLDVIPFSAGLHPRGYSAHRVSLHIQPAGESVLWVSPHKRRRPFRRIRHLSGALALAAVYSIRRIPRPAGSIPSAAGHPIHRILRPLKYTTVSGAASTL